MKEIKKVIIEVVQDSIDPTDNQVSISVLNTLLDQQLPEQLALYGVSGSLLEFEDDVNRMMELYKAHRYTQAEQLRDQLAERLDDIMRLGGNYH